MDLKVFLFFLEFVASENNISEEKVDTLTFYEYQRRIVLSILNDILRASRTENVTFDLTKKTKK
jgi:hypothetical protein